MAKIRKIGQYHQALFFGAGEAGGMTIRAVMQGKNKLPYTEWIYLGPPIFLQIPKAYKMTTRGADQRIT